MDPDRCPECRDRGHCGRASVHACDRCRARRGSVRSARFKPLSTMAPPSAAISPLRPDPSANPTSSPITVPFPTSVQVSAPSRDVVWALVGEQLLFRSIDRGETWLQRPLPTSAPNLELAFISEREGWLSSAGSAATECLFQSLRIWHTTDGGASYQRLPIVVTGAIGETPVGIPIDRCKTGLSFIDPGHGFLAGWHPSAAPVIYRTSDGGLSWTASRPLPDPPGFTTQPAASSLRPAGPVRAFGSTLLLEAFGNVLTGERRFVFRSDDGGSSWSYVAGVPIPSSIGFVTVSRWIQPLLPGQSQETTDGGLTWHDHPSDYQQTAPTTPAVVFADADVGYATNSRGGLRRTGDGGLHWTPLRTPGAG